MSEIKPCPFCGGKKIGIDNNVSVHKHFDELEIPVTHWVVCRTCFSSGSPTGSQKAAITAWNKRVGEKSK